ncbi:MAG: hypothetical protein DBX41_06420 [Clostridiales bacterium]|nr:MAG: hypothetical protein DBX41_06420 [Clostridiales bacterium]
MIDYTYWQDRVRLHLQNDSFAYRAVSVGNAAHFYLRLQEMNDEREAAWQTFLDEFQAREEKSAKWLFSPVGEIILRSDLLDEDELMVLAMSSGAEEMYTDTHNLAHFLCAENKLALLKDILSMEDVEIVHSFTSYRPQGLVEMYDKKEARRIYDFCEKLSECAFIGDLSADFGIGEYWIEEFSAE